MTRAIARRGAPAVGALIRSSRFSVSVAGLVPFCLLFGCLSPVELQQTLWQATLVAAPDFPGLTGSAAAVAEERFRRAEVGIQIMGGPPSSVLPWRIRAGACGDQGVVVGAAVSYPSLTTDEAGSAAQDAVLSQALRAGETYSVEVWRAPENDEVIACGTLGRL